LDLSPSFVPSFPDRSKSLFIRRPAMMGNAWIRLKQCRVTTGQGSAGGNPDRAVRCRGRNI
jgi:hypothetical protein